MGKKNVSLLVGSIMALSSVVFGGGLTTSQVDNMELAGVKIGMTEEEAVSRLIAKYNTSQDQLKFRRHISEDSVTGKKEIHQIAYWGSGENAYVDFTVDITQAPAVNVVSGVSYDMQYSKDNADNVENTLKQQFGDVSIPASSGVLVWCQTESKYDCKKGSTVFKLNRMGSINISMKNDSYSIARRAYEDKQKNKAANF